MSSLNQAQAARPTDPCSQPPTGTLRKLAGLLANSFLLGRGRRLFHQNLKDWNLPLSKIDKLMTGGYIILKDYSEGLFPPTFADQAKAYEAEITYYEAMPGVSLAENMEAHMRKPFWGVHFWSKFSRSFSDLLRAFDRLGVQPKSRILELGCGSGWMAEFLAMSGYSVVGTSIAPNEIQLAQQRTESLKRKGLPNELRFVVSPMESVDEAVGEPNAFDVVFVFEALHHAYDWRRAVQASFRCLKPGGWLLLANEPNVLHTFISYRVARIARLHEIGLCRHELVGEMQRCGFSRTVVLKPWLNNWVSQHWIAACK